MATFTSLRRAGLLAAAALVLGSGAPHVRADWTKNLDADERNLVGFAGHVPDSAKPKLTAFFPQESYAIGSTAQLEITDRASDVRVQMFRAGMRRQAHRGERRHDRQGRDASPEHRLRRRSPHRVDPSWATGRAVSTTRS